MNQQPAVFVRPERPQDHPAVFELNLRSFQRAEEARLVELLRAASRPCVSLVALMQDRINGHVLFTPARLEAAPMRMAMALGPLSVRPEHQRQGVGTRLVQVGLDACRIAAVELVFVVGDPRFYRRFGFTAAAGYGLTVRPDWDPYLLVAELRRGALEKASGRVAFRPEFSQIPDLIE